MNKQTSKLKTHVIVIGYPKSGNTWTVRLVAELLQCPVAGFWQSAHKEIAVEGLDRDSPFCCWKAHQRYEELNLSSDDKIKLIYVVRDPRDIVVSGASYFPFPPRKPLLHRILRRLPGGLKLYYSFIMTANYRKKLMTQTILKGRSATHKWCRVPWEEHLKSYQGREVLTIRYEDLLDDPEKVCARIVEYLDVQRDSEQIKAAIQNQSFATRRNRAQAEGQLDDLAHLRAGRKEQWRRHLSRHRQKQLWAGLRQTLLELGYSNRK